MKQLEITVHVRNNLLKERRLKAGLTQTALAKYANVPVGEVNAMECLRASNFCIGALKAVANYFECEPDDLFPDSFKSIKSNRALFAKVDVVDVDLLRGRIYKTEQLDSPERLAIAATNHDRVAEVLTTLSDKEQQLMRMRYGMDSGSPALLKEVGKEFGITRERVRQIESKCIRKLRHPSRSRLLAEPKEHRAFDHWWNLDKFSRLKKSHPDWSLGRLYEKAGIR